MMRGVIDALEENWALVVLDDGQRLYWPRDLLAEGAEVGMAIVLDLERGAKAQVREPGTWTGLVGAMAQGQSEWITVRLEDQALMWPGIPGLAVGQAVTVRMTVDVDDTERRRREVKELLDDLFAT